MPHGGDCIKSVARRVKISMKTNGTYFLRGRCNINPGIWYNVPGVTHAKYPNVQT